MVSVINQLLFETHQRNEPACIKLLATHPSLLNCLLTYEGETIFLLACRHNLKLVLNYVVGKNVNVHATTSSNLNGVYAAIHKGKVELIQYLHELGVDIDKHDWLGNTPLFLACEYGHTDIIKYLIEHGADVNFEKKENSFSFLDFYKKGFFELDMSFLIKHLDKFNQHYQKEIKKLRLKQLFERRGLR